MKNKVEAIKFINPVFLQQNTKHDNLTNDNPKNYPVNKFVKCVDKLSTYFPNLVQYLALQINNSKSEKERQYQKFNILHLS